MSDAKLHFSNSQSLAGVATTDAYGTYELDFETAYPDKGSGSPLVVRFLIMTSFTVATSVAFSICFDATSQATAGGGTVVATTGAIAIATLIAGYSFELKVPDEHLQYMNVKYTTVGTPGVGAVSAYLDIDTGLRHR
jgi:hypothetical protein